MKIQSGLYFPLRNGGKMNLITEYHNFLNEHELQQIWGATVCQAHWRFGQKSDESTIYPMWFQHYYDCKPHLGSGYRDGTYEGLQAIGNRFMDIVGDEYILLRNMVAGNTFGQDGDIHKDWLEESESLTGVLYLNRRWEDNWGGETIVYNKEQTELEISKFEAGKLIVFDGSNPHIGKGPQRACGELRSIIAVQAVKKDAWKRLEDTIPVPENTSSVIDHGNIDMNNVDTGSK